MRIKYFISIIIFSANLCSAQSIPILKNFDPQYKEKVFEHIVNLSNFGIRQAEQEGEKKTIDYLKHQFEVYGLSVEVEPFTFDLFTLKKAKVILNDNEIPYKSIYFNPYLNQNEYKGRAFFFHPDSSYQKLKSKDLSKNIVLTKSPARYFRLGLRNPKAIVYLDESDFDKLMNSSADVIIKIDGVFKKTKSYNVIATIISPSPTDSTIILSAHWDSILGPGASDNASGVGTLLELSKYFTTQQDQLTYNIKFLSIGSEEIGSLGTQAFITSHTQELKECKLLFNIDTVGGDKDIYIEQRGGIYNSSKVRGEIEIDRFKPILLKAHRDFNCSWNILNPLIFQMSASCKPKWLQQTITGSLSELKISYKPSNDMGSDHQLFAFAGIPATNISVSGTKIHCPEDNANNINKDNLERVGKIVATVVLSTMKK